MRIHAASDPDRILKERYPKLVLLILTVFDDDERIFRAVCAGASGYLLKRTPPLRLLEAIRKAFESGSPMSAPLPESASFIDELLKLFVDGHNYKSAAAELGVTVNTIGFHVQQIYSKLQVHSKPKPSPKRFARASFNPEDRIGHDVRCRWTAGYSGQAVNRTVAAGFERKSIQDGALSTSITEGERQ